MAKQERKLDGHRLISFVAFGLVVMLLTYLLVAHTSLRRTIPGYPSRETQQAAIENYRKVDSLEKVIDLWAFQVANIQRVVTGREALPLDARPMTDAVLKIPAGPELESLFLSLTPYLDSADALPQETAFQKRREGLRCVLATDRDFYASLFDFVQPWKIDLPGFMEENYLYDLSLPELARYSGRSLSSFKRDFKKISELTPEKWILQRRLADAHRLLAAGGCRVADAMLESGFKDPAFFSRAYRRRYGYPPRETPAEG